MHPAAGTDGVRVTVQQPGTIPNPGFEGFDIQSGVSTTIGVVATEVVRLPHPHGNCTNKNMELEWLKKATLQYKTRNQTMVARKSYRVGDCRAACLQR